MWEVSSFPKDSLSESAVWENIVYLYATKACRVYLGPREYIWEDVVCPEQTLAQPVIW